MPADEEDADEPWRMAPSRRPEPGSIGAPLPAKVTVTLADQLYLDRTELPSAMVARLVRVAAFQNPEFYRAQAMRLPTFGKHRIISCAELHTRHVGLPRGCLDEVVQLLTDYNVELAVQDLRIAGVIPCRQTYDSRESFKVDKSKPSMRWRRTTSASWRLRPPLAKRLSRPR